jgi:glycosyltransferase involved in cell wall biosynthesis
MRIGIFDPYLDDLGGGEKYMMTIAECLSENHDVDVFWDNEKDLKDLLKRFTLKLNKIKLVPNIFNLQTSTLQRLLKTKKYDAIIFLSDGSLPLLLSKKLFVHIQQPLKSMQSTGSLLDRIKISRVNRFFCNSEYTKIFIDKKFHLKTSILYPPVALYPKDLQKENIILHVGRFRIKNVKNDDYKKQAVMVSAFKEMITKGLKNWKLVLAISIQEKDKDAFEVMKKSARGFPIEFLVNKSNDELWDIYSKAKIYWHASGYGEDLEKNPEYAEHFGISTVEAMGSGVVPVVIDAGGQKEIVSDGINGFLWDSIKELQAKTLTLINDEALLNHLSKQAVQAAKRFSKEKFYEAVNALILE